MNSNYRIKLLKKANKKVVQDIFLLISQLNNASKKISVEYLKKIIRNKSIKIFIALNKNSQIVGIATIIFYRKVDGIYKGYIEDFVVDKNNRGKGIGKKLMNEILKTAKKIGLTTIHLTSNPKRINANLLYKKLGFKIYNTNYYKYNFKS